MKAHVLSNLSELEKYIRCEAVLSILSVFPNEFNKFRGANARFYISYDTKLAFY